MSITKRTVVDTILVLSALLILSIPLLPSLVSSLASPVPYRLDHMRVQEPRPYPIFGVENELCYSRSRCGNRNSSNNYQYTIQVPINEMESYYSSEMARYCGERVWPFVETRCDEFASCRVARCRLKESERSPNATFYVQLNMLSPTQTEVQQSETIHRGAKLCGK